MIKKRYDCDMGSVLVNCDGNLIRFSNGYGDGDYDVYCLENSEDFKKLEKDCLFLGMQYFKKAYVCNYDCLKLEDIERVNEDGCLIRGNIEEGNYSIEQIYLFELSGEYGLFCQNGDMFFVKTER